MAIRSFFKELKRRNVYKVATVYVITAWLVAQVIALAANTFSAPDWVMKMVLILLVLGFPIALVFAWAFELTPDGIKRTSSLSPAEKASENLQVRLNSWIIGLLVLALLFLGVERIFFAESTLLKDDNTETASIAVLPFEDFSAEKDQEYFADGISEELLNVLTKVKGLQVAGRTSSFQFKGQNPDLKMVGQQLGVDHILEGSVRKAGDQLRITAQLVRADNGLNIWSDTYDRSYTTENIFAIQEDISRQVLQELKIRLLPSEEKELKEMPTQNKEAYNLYLKGISKGASWNPEDLNEAIDYYNRATDLDPSFALAHARKALTYMIASKEGDLPYQEMTIKARRAIDMALIGKNDLAEAFTALGIYLMSVNEIQPALAAIEKAKSLKPGDAEIRAWAFLILLANDKVVEAEQELFYALKLDPLSPQINRYMGRLHANKNEFGKAEEYYIKSIELRPDYLIAFEALSQLYASNGRLDKSFITMARAVKKTGIEYSATMNVLVRTALYLELEAFAEELVKELIHNFPENLDVFWIYRDFLMYNRRYNEAYEFIKNYDAAGRGMSNSNFISAIGIPALLGNKSETFLKYAQEHYKNALSTEMENFEEVEVRNIINASIALQNTGNKERAKTLLQNLYKYIISRPEREYQDQDGRYFIDNVIIQSLLGNKESTYDFFRSRIENQRIHSHWLVYGTWNELYFGLTEDELEPFKEAELEIIRKQRRNVVDYLKKEGDWKEEWEEYLEL